MRRSIWVLFWVFAIFFVAGIVFFHFFVNPIVADYSKAKIETMTVKAVNRAVAETVNTGTYQQLTEITYGADGKITGMHANVAQINGLSNEIALRSQGFLELFASTGISVPVGTFSGVPVFTGKGPDIKLRVVPVGSVNCIFESEFLGAGINQTRHRVMLKVKSIVNLVMPLGSRNVTAEIEVMLCESVIVGEVPEFYFSK